MFQVAQLDDDESPECLWNLMLHLMGGFLFLQAQREQRLGNSREPDWVC